MYTETLAHIHRDELVAEAEQYRLAQNAVEAQPPMAAKLMENIGEALTQAGEYLLKQALVAQTEWELKHCPQPRYSGALDK